MQKGNAYKHPYGGSYDTLEAQKGAEQLIASIEKSISEEHAYQRYMEYLDEYPETDPDWNASCERANKLYELAQLLKWFAGKQ